MLSIAEVTEDGVRCSGGGRLPESCGARVDRAGGTFSLRQQRLSATPVYYRLDYGRIEFSHELTDFAPAESPSRVGELDSGTLLALVHGTPPPPTAALFPGVHQLALGTVLRADSTGVTVRREQPELPASSSGVLDTVSEIMGELGDNSTIAYSGGLSSAFLAVCARRAGVRPRLAHADLGAPFDALPRPNIPGFVVDEVPVDPAELLDHQTITGAEPYPPLPDTIAPQRLLARLHRDETDWISSGAFLRNLLFANLSQADTGPRGWRLLTCEPFHVTGTLPNLGQAREILGEERVHAPGLAGSPVAEEQPVGTPAMPQPVGSGVLPGLTKAGEDAHNAAWQALMALWQQHFDSLPAVLGNAGAGLAEHGTGGALLPAVDQRLLAAVRRVPNHDLTRIRRGHLETHVPMRRALRQHRVPSVSEAAAGFWMRRAAADHLRREREKITAQLCAESALADLGLIEPQIIADTLADGHEIALHALPLLRLTWLDQWLRGRS